jgi:FkbM family methyltransferase
MDLNKIKNIFKKPSYLKTLWSLYKLRINTRKGEIQTTSLLGPLFKLSNGVSFSFLYNEIYINEIYKFQSNNNKPYILDCGANIGVSVCYFKKLYPNSEIVAFEPDEKLFEILSDNILNSGLEDVKLINKALWHENSEISFFSEGGDAGRIALNFDKINILKVQTTRLREYLYKDVDLLKLDIEGAEFNVVKDCLDLLRYVNNIFVEYHSFENQPQKLGQFLSLLEDAGFRLIVTSPGIINHHPFIRRNRVILHNMDMQLNIYGYR